MSNGDDRTEAEALGEVAHITVADVDHMNVEECVAWLNAANPLADYTRHDNLEVLRNTVRKRLRAKADS